MESKILVESFVGLEEVKKYDIEESCLLESLTNPMHETSDSGDSKSAMDAKVSATSRI